MDNSLVKVWMKCSLMILILGGSINAMAQLGPNNAVEDWAPGYIPPGPTVAEMKEAARQQARVDWKVFLEELDAYNNSADREGRVTTAEFPEFPKNFTGPYVGMCRWESGKNHVDIWVDKLDVDVSGDQSGDLALSFVRSSLLNEDIFGKTNPDVSKLLRGVKIPSNGINTHITRSKKYYVSTFEYDHCKGAIKSTEIQYEGDRFNYPLDDCYGVKTVEDVEYQFDQKTSGGEQFSAQFGPIENPFLEQDHRMLLAFRTILIPRDSKLGHETVNCLFQRMSRRNNGEEK